MTTRAGKKIPAGVTNLKRGCLGPAVILACLALGVLFLLMAKQVDAGETCVKTRYGDVVGTVGPGLHLRIPFIEGYACYSQRSVVYEASNEPQVSNADYPDASVSFNTPDGQEALANYTILWSIVPEQVECAYRETGRNMDEVNRRAVLAISRSRVRLIASRYDAEQLFSGRLEPGAEINLSDPDYETVLELLEREITVDLTPRLAERCVTLDDFLLRKFTFSEDFVNAREELKSAEAEAQRVETLAKGEARATRERADAQAYSLQVIADTLQKYPDAVAQLLVQLQFMTEFSGQITWGVVPEGVNPFIQVPTSQSSSPASE
jgi:regulator of protease activity HflC (stomatin/prohibitin superfamily)